MFWVQQTRYTSNIRNALSTKCHNSNFIWLISYDIDYQKDKRKIIFGEDNLFFVGVRE